MLLKKIVSADTAVKYTVYRFQRVDAAPVVRIFVRIVSGGGNKDICLVGAFYGNAAVGALHSPAVILYEEGGVIAKSVVFESAVIIESASPGLYLRALMELVEKECEAYPVLCVTSEMQTDNSFGIGGKSAPEIFYTAAGENIVVFGGVQAETALILRDRAFVYIREVEHRVAKALIRAEAVSRFAGKLRQKTERFVVFSLRKQLLHFSDSFVSAASVPAVITGAAF